MATTEAEPTRPSIEERAERRRSLQRTYPDRYTGLIQVLRRGRHDGGGRLLSDPARWHPVMRQLIVASFVAVALIAAFYVLNELWRAGRIDTWSGPTSAVTSGQEMLACLPDWTQRDDALPTWMRYGDLVYAKTDRLRALRGQGRVGETGQIEAGYRLGDMRLLLPPETPEGQPPRSVFIVIEPGPAATIYELAPDCP
jgi:hypothetical protein